MEGLFFKAFNYDGKLLASFLDRLEAVALQDLKELDGDIDPILLQVEIVHLSLDVEANGSCLILAREVLVEVQQHLYSLF